MVLDLVIIGVVITLGPLNTAFILLLSSDRGVRTDWRSSWDGSPASWRSSPSSR